MSLKVLVTSAGRRVQLVRALRAAVKRFEPCGLVVTSDSGILAPATYISDGHFVVPRIGDQAFEPTFVDLCREQSIDLVVPTIDTELATMARLRSDLMLKGTEIVVSDPETVELAADKRALNRWLRERGLPATEQYPLRSVDAGTLPFPVVVKPAQGSMSIGVTTAESSYQLDDLTLQLEGDDWVVERLAVGQEFTVSTYIDRSGKCLAAVPRLRLEVRGGEVSKARTVRQPAVEEIARQTVELLPGARGPMNVQIIYNESTEVASIIEVNARFGGGDPLAWESGADAPLWTIQEHLGLPIGLPKPWRADLTMLRFDDAVYLAAEDFHGVD